MSSQQGSPRAGKAGSGGAVPISAATFPGAKSPSPAGPGLACPPPRTAGPGHMPLPSAPAGLGLAVGPSRGHAGPCPSSLQGPKVEHGRRQGPSPHVRGVAARARGQRSVQALAGDERPLPLSSAPSCGQGSSRARAPGSVLGPLHSCARTGNGALDSACPGDGDRPRPRARAAPPHGSAGRTRTHRPPQPPTPRCILGVVVHPRRLAPGTTGPACHCRGRAPELWSSWSNDRGHVGAGG